MRIGITQRVEVVASYGERRDCLDQQWFLFMEALGYTPIPIPNRLDDVRRWVRAAGIEGLILSGGNDLTHLPGAVNTAPERDQLEVELLSWAHENEVPVIGVCRGLQIMNVWLGGDLVPVEGHVAVRHPLVSSSEAKVCFQQCTEVNSYHGWGGIASNGLAGALTPQCYSPRGGMLRPFCIIDWPGRVSCGTQSASRHSATLTAVCLIIFSEVKHANTDTGCRPGNPAAALYGRPP